MENNNNINQNDDMLLDIDRDATTSTEPDEQGSVLKRMFNALRGKAKDKPFNAENAWLQSMYCSDFMPTPEERIIAKQKSIQDAITCKFRKVQNNMSVTYSSFHCVIDIEDDLVGYIEQIFKPFRDGNFDIINLSEKVDAIANDHVYLISWRNAFAKH